MKSSTPPGTHSFIYLQYLRGIAALMVVYFHAVMQLKNFSAEAPLLPVVGEAGVDLFFVLSGFLMWITTAGKDVSPGSFMLKRLMRIVPLYWMLTIVAGAVALLAPSLLKHTVLGMTHFISSLAFFPALNPAYLDSTDTAVLITPLLVPGWTLNYEIFFYVIFAGVLFFPQRLRLWLIGAVFVAVTLIGRLSGDVGPALTFYSNPIIFEFLMGIGVAILVRRQMLLNGPMACVLTLVALAVMLLANYADLVPQRAVAFGIPAALIVYGLCCMEIRATVRNFVYLRVVGDASYSLYLTHVFTLVVCRLIFQRFYNGHSLGSELAFIALSLVLSVIVGIMTYYLYEKPASGVLNKFKARAVVPADVRS
ncbi:acyltransferase [Xanthomonas sp. WHRI 1810A]|uniref:acyltransferase family protein n=1 Tax=Xanthomonas sp. WHRI 1810A TaxID=3161565 RepID=UPI0032E915F2